MQFWHAASVAFGRRAPRSPSMLWLPPQWPGMRGAAIFAAPATSNLDDLGPFIDAIGFAGPGRPRALGLTAYVPIYLDRALT